VFFWHIFPSWISNPWGIYYFFVVENGLEFLVERESEAWHGNITQNPLPSYNFLITTSLRNLLHLKTSEKWKSVVCLIQFQVSTIIHVYRFIKIRYFLVAEKWFWKSLEFFSLWRSPAWKQNLNPTSLMSFSLYNFLKESSRKHLIHLTLQAVWFGKIVLDNTSLDSAILRHFICLICWRHPLGIALKGHKILYFTQWGLKGCI
jgi:hypothetical protein